MKTGCLGHDHLWTDMEVKYKGFFNQDIRWTEIGVNTRGCFSQDHRWTELDYSCRNHEPMDVDDDIHAIRELFSSTRPIPDEQHQEDNPEQVRSGVGQSEVNGPVSRMVPSGHRFSQASGESNSHQAIKDIQAIRELFSSTLTIPDEQHQEDNPEREQMRLPTDEEPILTDTDLNSLQGKNWLSLNVVDWVLYKMLDPFPHLKFLRGTEMYKLIEHSPVDFLKNLGGFQFIVGPYLRRDHFSLVVIGMQEKTVYFYDPVLEEGIEMDTILQAVRQQFADPDPEWRIHQLEYLRQIDTYNCGVYTVLCAYWFIFGNHLTDDPSNAREMFTKLSERCRDDPFNKRM